ncbi:hypothetical protein AAE478_000179 [Parahypoxylon ruwenzoriense]
MGFSYPRNLRKIALPLSLLTLLISSSSATSSSPSPSKSPTAETELICHTNNPADCYPKVFSATEEFQVVHEDQDLPPGLHVRLDIQTGLKQAKLHKPAEEDGGNPALEGLPVDRSVVVINPEGDGDGNDAPRIPRGAPAYEPVGIVKAPKEKSAVFVQALEAVKQYVSDNQPDALGRALEDLEELSHDMYYGLQIAEDAEALRSLFCLLTSRDAAQAAGDQRPLTQRPDFLASSILASSVRNNKPALRAVEESWDAIAGKQCAASPRTDKDDAAPSLRSALYAHLAPTSSQPRSGSSPAAEAYTTRLRLAVLDGLLRSPKIRAEFLERDGMRGFLRILLRTATDNEEEAWRPRRAKVARIVSDVFLDEEAGATLGIWPTTAALTDARICAEGGDPEALDEGCWEYHLEVMSRDPRDAEWSRPLLDLLRRRRLDASTAARLPGRDEL